MNLSSLEACLKSFFCRLKVAGSTCVGLSLAFMLPLLSTVETSAQTITLTGSNSPASGITQGNLTLGQRDVVLFGFGLSIRGTLTVNEFNINIVSPDNHNDYFTEFRLYRSSDNIFSADDIRVNSTTKFKKNNLNIGGLSEAFSSETNKYYFLVANYTSASETVPGSIQFGFSSQQKEEAIVSGKKGYQSSNIIGRNFTISESAISVTNLNSDLSPSPIAYGQKDILLFGFGLQVEGMSVIKQINVSSTNKIGNYFTNGRLYKSADKVLSPDDALVASILINNDTDKILSIPNLSESFNGSPERYYFLVADYTVNGPVNNQSIQFYFSENQAQPALTQSDPKKRAFNSFNIQGRTLSFLKAGNWLGSANSDWNNAANWSAGYIPGASDVANIGSLSFINQPRIFTNSSVGSIVLGTAKPVVLSIDSGVTVSVNELIQTSADASIVNTLTGKGSLQANSLKINDASSLIVYGAAHATKLVSEISNLSLNNLLLRSGFRNYVNNAEIEVKGNLNINGSIQSINENAENNSSLTAASGSVISLLSGSPFSLSATGTNTILSNGLIRYVAAVPQSVEPFVSYTDLELSGAGVKMINAAELGPFYLKGSLSIVSPATIAYSSNINSINIRGDFKGNSSLKSGGFPVNIGGSWLNSVRDTLIAKISYDGEENQTVGALSYNVVSFSNGGIKSIAGPASVKSLVEVSANTILNTGNNLTLLADSLSYASIKPLVNGADIQGKVTVKSFIKGGKRGYLNLSSPVYDTISTVNPAIKGFTYSQLKTCMPLTGNGGPANGFDAGAIVNPNGPTVRLYREQSSPTQAQYTYPLTVRDTISSGKGFFFYFRGNRDNIYYKVNPPYITPENIVMEYNGFVNRGDINVPITFTNYSNPGDDGFNVVGNPYAATIDLHLLLAGTPYTKVWIQTLNNTFAIYDLTLQSGTNGASRYIMPGQSFYVQAKAPGVLTFTEYCKVNSITTSRVMSVGRNAGTAFDRTFEYIKIRATGGKDNISDEAMIVFKDGSSSDRTVEDASQISGATSLIASISSDSSALAINYIPMPDTDQNIKLKLSGDEGGAFRLSISEGTVKKFADILIRDNYTNTIKSIKDGSAYSFVITPKIAATYGAERFVLQFKGLSEMPSDTKDLSLVVSKGTGAEMQVFPNPVSDNLQVRIDNNNQPIEIRIFNTSGKLMKKAAYTASGLISLDVSELNPGNYILEVKGQNKSIIYNTKFIKK